MKRVDRYDTELVSIGKPCLPAQEKQAKFFEYLAKHPGSSIDDFQAVGIGRGSVIAMIGFYGGTRLKVNRKVSPVEIYPL